MKERLQSRGGASRAVVIAMAPPKAGKEKKGKLRNATGEKMKALTESGKKSLGVYHGNLF